MSLIEATMGRGLLEGNSPLVHWSDRHSPRWQALRRKPGCPEGLMQMFGLVCKTEAFFPSYRLASGRGLSARCAAPV